MKAILLPITLLVCICCIFAFGNNIASDWKAKDTDNICGVSVVQQVSNPAKVNYDKLTEATKAYKTLVREGVSRSSARGQVLLTEARGSVLAACKKAMAADSYCSVWKAITNKKGVKVPDITQAAKQEL
jgi:hypothetical protein